MKHYTLDDPEVSLTPIDAEYALRRMSWDGKKKLLIEFPEDVYDTPVLRGVGCREHNPLYPLESSQRYRFRGSPHDLRIPRRKNGRLLVRYIRKNFEVKAYVRRHASGAETIAFKAERT